MTKRQWSFSYLALFFLGVCCGFATAGPVQLTTSHNGVAMTRVLFWGVQHLFALTIAALFCLLWAVIAGKVKESKGLAVYFGIGLCLARLVHGS